MARSFRILFFHIQTVYQIHAQIARAAAGLFCDVFPFPGTWLRDIRFFTQTASTPIDGDLVFQADRCHIVPDGAWKICASVTGSISKFPIRFSAWARGKSKFLTYPAKARAISAAYGTRHRKAPISGCFAPESHRFTRIRTSMENSAWEIRQRERKIYEYRCFFGEIMLQYV